LTEYNRIPQRVEIKTILQVELINQGLGWMLLREIPVEVPYLKDYEASGELACGMPKKYNVRDWGFSLPMAGASPGGAATVACDSCFTRLLGVKWKSFWVLPRT